MHSALPEPPRVLAGPSKLEVMLELMLVDAHVTLQRDILMATGPSTEAHGAPAHSLIPGSSECDLFVLISRAVGLPELNEASAQGGESQKRPPSAFVAAKSSRDIIHGGGVQGATHVASASCSPHWSAFLACPWWHSFHQPTCDVIANEPMRSPHTHLAPAHQMPCLN